MKFFYLSHGKVSYECLKDLVNDGFIPEFVVTHKELEYEKLQNLFYVPINKLCEDNNIPIYGVNKINEVNEFISSCDIGICLGFMEIIRKETLELPKFGIMNVHGGKLPKYRGRAPISRSIMNGEDSFTLTLHKMDEGVDSGDICLESHIPITDNDDLNTLYEKCSAEAAPLVEKFFTAFKNGSLDCYRQDLSQNPKPYRKITDEERKINWNMASRKVFDLVRALIPPFPGSWFEFKGNNFIVLEAAVSNDDESCEPGMIISSQANKLNVKCGSGSVDLITIADENLNPVSIIDNFHKGDILS